ncbi:hypothetical protein GC174_09125 [bacterium]|nr:hypothetical protein [bacterium]
MTTRSNSGVVVASRLLHKDYKKATYELTVTNTGKESIHYWVPMEGRGSLQPWCFEASVYRNNRKRELTFDYAAFGSGLPGELKPGETTTTWIDLDQLLPGEDEVVVFRFKENRR